MIEGDDHPQQSETRPGPAESDALPHGGTNRDRFSNLRSLSHTAVALLLYIVIVDAVVETFLSGAPVRGIVTVVIVGYLAATVLLWRRFEWATKAAASFLMLLLLLVLTTWLPDGVVRGVTLLKQPTSTLLALVTAPAILVSGIGLVRLRSLPAAVRWAAGFLTAYGVAAFLNGIVTGTAYPDLFHGASLWIRLPFWLQGAFIGALVLVPAAVFFQIGTGLLRTRGPQLRSRGLQVLGLSLSVLIAVAGIRASAGSGLIRMQTRDLGSGKRIGPIVFAQGESGTQPVGRADQFKEGIKAVHAFLNFEGLKAEDTASAIWYKGAEKLRDHTVKVSEVYGANPLGKGHLWFTITFEGGAPPGGYFLEISINDSFAQFGGFTVDPK